LIYSHFWSIAQVIKVADYLSRGIAKVSNVLAQIRRGKTIEQHGWLQKKGEVRETLN
jgi:hypothetical protein